MGKAAEDISTSIGKKTSERAHSWLEKQNTEACCLVFSRFALRVFNNVGRDLSEIDDRFILGFSALSLLLQLEQQATRMVSIG